jgi:hypothetical protein
MAMSRQGPCCRHNRFGLPRTICRQRTCSRRHAKVPFMGVVIVPRRSAADMSIVAIVTGEPRRLDPPSVSRGAGRLVRKH